MVGLSWLCKQCVLAVRGADSSCLARQIQRLPPSLPDTAPVLHRPFTLYFACTENLE